LQAAREHGTSQVLVTSTSETYGTAQYVPIDEKHPAVGQSPYSATKIGADQLAISYYRSFDLPVKIVRPFNTYGPRQSSRAFIPTIISQVLAGKEEIHVGNLTPTRDLTFVKDTANGFIQIMKSDKLFGEATNIGMDEEISMGDLAQMIARLMGKEIKLTTDDNRVRPANSEVERLRCNNTKITSLTSWRPEYTLEIGLEETIAWMKEHLQVYKPELYNV
jgi:nucleoside-diphosphate-sugar epimerase